MTEITKEQEIILGNFKEQYNSIRKNIEVANGELEEVLAKREKESRDFEAGLIEHTHVMGKLRAEQVKLVDVIANEQDRIHGEQRKLDADRSEFEQYKKEILSIITLEKSTLLSAQMTAEKFSREMAERVREMKPEYESLLKRIEEANDKFKVLEAAISEREKELRNLDELAASAENKLNETLEFAIKELKNKAQELIDAEKLVQEERARVQTPWETLQLEKESFEKYRMDVRVLYDRANRMWTLMYPGQSIEDILTRK